MGWVGFGFKKLDPSQTLTPSCSRHRSNCAVHAVFSVAGRRRDHSLYPRRDGEVELVRAAD